MEEYVWISQFINNATHKDNVYPIFKKVALEYGIKISIIGPADGSDEEYINAVYAVIKRKVSGIMIVGARAMGIIDAINQAIHLSIPVITVECDIFGCDRFAHVGANWFRMGQSMADRMAKMINGPGKVLMLGMSEIANIEAGFRGFSDRINQYSDIQLLGPEDSSGKDYNQAELIVTQYLKHYPDLAGIVAFDSNGSLGAAQALEKFLKVRSVKLICTDADTLQLEYLKKGIIDAAFSSKHQYSAYLAFQMIYAYNHGSISTGYKPGLINIPGNIDTGYIVVTQKNIDSFQKGFDIKEALNRHHLSQQVNLFTNMLENISDIVITSDLSGNIFYANTATSIKLGYKKEDITKLDLTSIFNISDEFINCLDEGLNHNIETEAIKKNNSTFPVQISISPLKVEKGISGYVIIATDISEREIIKTQIKEKQETLDSIFRAAPVAIGLVINRIFQWTNQRIFGLTGYSQEELVGQCSRMLYLSEEEFLRVGQVKYNQIKEYGTGTVQTEWKCKDGTIKQILLSSSYIDPEYPEKGVIFTALDIIKNK